MKLRGKSKETDVELGDEVKDRITGFTGIVMDITVWIAGCERIGIQSQKLENGIPLDNQTFDRPNLEIVKKQVFKPAKQTKHKFKLGDKVKDTISGYTGIVTSLSQTVHGSNHIAITPQKLKDEKPMDSLCFKEHRVEAIALQKLKEPKNKPTGGDQIKPRMVM